MIATIIIKIITTTVMIITIYSPKKGVPLVLAFCCWATKQAKMTDD